MQGSLVALITPFNAKGEIDLSALVRLIHFQVENGTDGLVLCGSTGEGAALSLEEKLTIFQIAQEEVRGKIPLIATTGSNVTKESVLLTQKAKEIGMDGAIAIVPYYSRPSFSGCLEHFRQIANVGLPLIVYHHPGRTGLKLSSEELLEISSLEGVCGIKEASGDFSLAMELVRSVALYSGDDSLALPQMSIGFTGSISIVGNVIPKEWKAFVDTQNRELFFELYPLCQALNFESNPICVKYAMSKLGLCEPHLRLPLVEPSAATKEQIDSILDLVWV